MSERGNDWAEALARQLGPRLRLEFDAGGSPNMTQEIAERLERLRRAECDRAAEKATPIPKQITDRPGAAPADP